jgi:ribonuclease BN (tRNA processing enzyme)
MKLDVIGCSPAWHNPGGAQSGYLLDGPGRLLLDCGAGVLAHLRQRGAWPHVDAVVITHFHLDHWGDLVPWAFGTQFGPGRAVAPQPALWVPPGGAEKILAVENLLGAHAILEAFALQEYAEGTPFEAAGYTITPVRVPHYDQLTFALRVTDGERTLAYSGDSAPSPALAEVARDADLFLCEATLAAPEPGLRGHLTAAEAVAAFEESGARRLLVVHRPAELPLDPSLEQATDGFKTAV